MVDQSELESAFGFAPDDLQANREGRLSRRQIHRLSAEQDWAVAGAAAATISLGFLFVSLIMYFVIVPALGVELGAATCLVITAWITLSLILAQVIFTVARGLLHRRMRRREFASSLRQRMRNAVSGAGVSLPHAQVERIDGVLTRQSDGEHEYLMLGDVEVGSSITEDDHRLWELEIDRHYALYRVKGPGWIVSAELVD
ncbi:MAG: hypothetical protein IPM16_01410 [Chloroflexi bacterium]|nr:hypothetical protein [Chloroflexota bacterium]